MNPGMSNGSGAERRATIGDPRSGPLLLNASARATGYAACSRLLCPVEENPKDLAEIASATSALKLRLFHLAADPVSFIRLHASSNCSEGTASKSGSREIDVYDPARIVQSANRDTKAMLPLSIALRQVPSLKAFKFFHAV